jgi:hypothetical protein
VAGLGLALALAVALGVAQLIRHDSARTEGPAAVTNGAPALPAQSTAPAEVPAPVVYVAASQEQAASALRFSAEINALRAELGQPQVSVGVLIAETGSTPALEALPGAPGTRYFDHR